MGIMPKPTDAGAPEKLGQLDCHALVFPARHKGKDKNNQLGKSKFAVTSEIGAGQLCLRIDVFWDNSQEKVNSSGGLAWFFKAGTVP